MAEMPFPITAKDAAQLIQQALRMFEDMYQERLGGASIGDVFQIGSDDVFTLMISSGLEKESGYLQVSISGTGGLQFTSGELACKVKSGGGISVDADGLQVSGENQLFFKTFTPTSGEPVVADQNADTMTLTEGAGISITGTAATDDITIANTDGGAAATAAHELAYDHDHYDTAYGWGDHAGLYDTVGTGAGAVATHESTYDHSLIGVADIYEPLVYGPALAPPDFLTYNGDVLMAAI